VEELSELKVSPHKSKSGLLRIWNALFYSLAGFKAAYHHEHAFRQECPARGHSVAGRVADAHQRSR
jgi:diacylglycerol kinase